MSMLMLMSMLEAVEALIFVSLFLLSLWFFDVFKIIKSHILYFLKPKEAKVLILGRDVPEHLGVFAHEAGGNAWEYFIKEMKIIFLHLRGPWTANGVWRYSTQAGGNTWEYFIKEMKIIFFHLGGAWMANRVWRDYTQMDAIVYIMESSWQQQELHALLFQLEAFANVRFLILCIRNPGIDLSEEDMLNHLGLNKVQLANANVRPLEVFVVEKFNREHYLERIKWLYDHLTNH